MSSYVMSHDSPVMLKSDVDFWETIDELDTHMWSSGEKPHPEADNIRWVDKLAEQLGFTTVENFPISYDGSGCSIISRYKEPEKCAKGFADFEYVAFLSMHFDHTVIVGIPNDMALLQFYQLVRPMLMLQSEKRFQNADDYEGTWDRGKNYKDLYQRLLANWNERQTKEENS